MLILSPILEQLGEHGGLPEGVIKHEVGEDLYAEVLQDDPVQKISVEQLNILAFDDDALALVFFLRQVSILDAFLLQSRGKVVAVAGED